MTPDLRIGEMEVIEALQSKCEQIGQKGVAKEFGLSAQYINDVLRNRRDVSERLAAKLGFERLVTYRRQDAEGGERDG